MYRSDRDQTDPSPTRSPSYAIAWLAEHAVPVAFGAYLACVFVLVCSPWIGWMVGGLLVHVFVSTLQAAFRGLTLGDGPPSKAASVVLAASWLALVPVVVIAVVRFAWLTSP